jgi:arylsulfatase A-like enzyme
MSSAPNIVEFIMHDLGTHLACYGESGAHTPNIDALAGESLVFDNMFCTAPQCSPARASIMTGCYPHSVGMMGLAHLGWGYAPGQRTLTQIARAHGYRTYLGGIHHECDRGPERFVREKLGYDEYSPREPVDLLRRAVGEDGPFFFSMGFFAAHRPFEADVTDEQVTAAVLPPYVPDTPATRRDVAQLEALVAQTDETIGEALRVLDESGAADETIVLFTTDHGPDLNRAKMTLYDPGIRVSCLLRLPPAVMPGPSRGARVPALASTIDILPTLLDLIGVQTPEFVQGRSLVPAIEAAHGRRPSAAAGRDYIVAEKTYHVIYDPQRCIRTRRYKYGMNWKPYQPIQLTVQHSVRIGLDRCGELYGAARGEEELYDLERDPGETNNVAYEPEYDAVRARLREQLLTVGVRFGSTALRAAADRGCPDAASELRRR